MAIVFESTKKNQRTLFWGISLLVVVLLMIVFLAAFPPEFLRKGKVLPGESVAPDLNINLDILDSNQVKNLESFKGIEMEANNIGRNAPFAPY